MPQQLIAAGMNPLLFQNMMMAQTGFNSQNTPQSNPPLNASNALPINSYQSPPGFPAVQPVQGYNNEQNQTNSSGPNFTNPNTNPLQPFGNDAHQNQPSPYPMPQITPALGPVPVNEPFKPQEISKPHPRNEGSFSNQDYYTPHPDYSSNYDGNVTAAPNQYHDGPQHNAFDNSNNMPPHMITSSYSDSFMNNQFFDNRGHQFSNENPNIITSPRHMSQNDQMSSQYNSPANVNQHMNDYNMPQQNERYNNRPPRDRKIDRAGKAKRLDKNQRYHRNFDNPSPRNPQGDNMNYNNPQGYFYDNGNNNMDMGFVPHQGNDGFNMPPNKNLPPMHNEIDPMWHKPFNNNQQIMNFRSGSGNGNNMRNQNHMGRHPQENGIFPMDMYQGVHGQHHLAAGSDELFIRHLSANEILKEPGRSKRAEKICVIIRGMPCVGKREMASKIAEIETKESNANKVKVLSVYDYLENCENDQFSNFSKRSNYCHSEMQKALVKLLSSKIYNFIIVVGFYALEKELYDVSTKCVNHGVDCVVVEMPHDMNKSLQMEGLNFPITKKDIHFIHNNWNLTPVGMIRLDVECLE